MTARYVVGIDLGTTNSALAYAPLDDDAAPVQLLAVPQLVARATVESQSLLPSFLYIPPDHEAAGGGFDLPWTQGATCAVGTWARRLAAEQPMRVVAGAKSWLAHHRVDRRAAILPWNAPAEVAKRSPVDAARCYLEHLASAWAAAFPDAPLAAQRVVLTVPASFDASARELTREAAQGAGLPEDLVLLEEPQAAVYAWLADRGDAWRRELGVGDTLLVCDVGGGTTDFTLVEVAAEAGQLHLRRVAVGNHILVGGDNMDLALAYHAAQLLKARGVELDPWQSVGLWHACRAAKERLLGDDPPDACPVSVLGRGSKLIAKTVSVELERAAAASLLLDGFLPACGADEGPARRGASGFRELGLPYEADTAITRHLAAFLRSHGGTAGAMARPTHILFNGGVFKSAAIRTRLLATVDGWWGGAGGLQVLSGEPDLDHAVARGAAYYGRAKQGRGVRIRGGTARAYYVGIESSGLAIPGVPRPLQALCVVPFGMEEGTETDVPNGEVGLVLGEETTFRFFGSATRKHDQPGLLLTAWTDGELEETDPLSATLPAVEDDPLGYVPVRFQARLTELGVLELWCLSTRTDHRWKLEFSVRDEA